MTNALEELTGGFQAPDTLSYAGTFTLTELEPPSGRAAHDFTAIFMTMPVVTAGYGGWSRVARPRRKALTEWAGRDSVSLSWDFMIDEYVSQKSDWVEAQCRHLDRMAGIGKGEPPLLSLISNPLKMIPFGEAWAPGFKWFIESLTWMPDRILVGAAGQRLRAAGSLTVTQYVEDKRLSLAQRKADEKPASSARLKWYQVKKGDTLQSIAAKKNIYGDKSKWKKIATANKIRDPKHLKKGDWLKIP